MGGARKSPGPVTHYGGVSHRGGNGTGLSAFASDNTVVDNERYQLRRAPGRLDRRRFHWRPPARGNYASREYHNAAARHLDAACMEGQATSRSRAIWHRTSGGRLEVARQHSACRTHRCQRAVSSRAGPPCTQQSKERSVSPAVSKFYVPIIEPAQLLSRASVPIESTYRHPGGRVIPGLVSPGEDEEARISARRVLDRDRSLSQVLEVYGTAAFQHGQVRVAYKDLSRETVGTGFYVCGRKNVVLVDDRATLRRRCGTRSAEDGLRTRRASRSHIAMRPAQLACFEAKHGYVATFEISAICFMPVEAARHGRGI